MNTYLTIWYFVVYYYKYTFIHSLCHCFSLPSCHSQVVKHWRQDEGQDTNDQQQLLLGLSLDHLHNSFQNHQNHWLNFRFWTPGISSFFAQPAPTATPQQLPGGLRNDVKASQIGKAAMDKTASGNPLHFNVCLLRMFTAGVSSFTTYSLDNQTWSISFMSITGTPSASVTRRHLCEHP